MSNYTVLQENTLAGFNEVKGDLYMKLFDKYQGHSSRDNERKAFLEACRYSEGVGGTIEYIFNNYEDYKSTDTSRLENYFASKWYSNFSKP